ncbi:8-demethyl-8-alpha-L-rhamnosyl tetracenomycin-C 2'-O-methyltransferase [Aliiroseovarius pelagivivens]|uniref:8-demethyl-8-alpha-L-rhamnosyl tetracenomycin-C 2'-O-methyltransferase n=1 Tax=Aliiroseovarius pelagivivens TaxID=1639690 RepID=A0A2R8AS59_9RHOB|nr:tetratricopeptide repeat protein [Aliiroseovarius pelagivivens]SPF78901.1 8-demethyl-8-alpha-L-rhamnosyl tetracenomycin-C 2'-O-methyltransferase [Aliiroseovarius pelagivivens]
MTDPLSTLAILHGTDKFGYHDYTPNYFKLLAHLRDKPVKILEIGVGGYADVDRGGQSLRMWRDFFKNGEVTGIDIQKKTLDFGPRVKILQGSQVDPDFLHEVIAERGPFDIIIDDGSHRNEHIVESYHLLFPTLAPGGIYIAEDVQTSFHPRFGGSLTLDEPNSVGFFGILMQQLNTDSDDPLIQDVAGMERYHNIIALHKRDTTRADRDVFTSSLFERFEHKLPKLIFHGRDDVDLTALTKLTGPTATAQNDSAADIAIWTLSEDAPFDADILEARLSDMGDNSVLVLRSDDPAHDFDPNGEVMEYAMYRFTLVDHVEILVHYPEATIDALAPMVYSIERTHDALTFHKSPNAYPSNFAYDAKNPQASSALDQMETVLADATDEGGLVQYAEILIRHRSREAAAGILKRLEKLGATSREFYLMAGALAQRERRLDDAERLFTTALLKFKNDPQFSVMLAGVKIGKRQLETAEEILRNAHETSPRARAVIAQLIKVLTLRGNLPEAIDLARKSVTMFPQPDRPGRFVLLGQLLRQENRPDEARNAIQKALDLAPDNPDALIELAEQALIANDVQSARHLVEKVQAAHPANPSLAALLKRITD